MHEGGYRIRNDDRGRWYFKRPDGRAIPAYGYRPEDMVDDGIDDGDETTMGGATAEAPGTWQGFADAVGVRETAAPYEVAH